MESWGPGKTSFPFPRPPSTEVASAHNDTSRKQSKLDQTYIPIEPANGQVLFLKILLSCTRHPDGRFCLHLTRITEPNLLIDLQLHGTKATSCKIKY